MGELHQGHVGGVLKSAFYAGRILDAALSRPRTAHAAVADARRVVCEAAIRQRKAREALEAQLRDAVGG